VWWVAGDPGSLGGGVVSPSGLSLTALALIGVVGLGMIGLPPVLLTMSWRRRAPAALGLVDLPSPAVPGTVQRPRIPLLDGPAGLRRQLVLLAAKDACGRRWTAARSTAALAAILGMCGLSWGSRPDEPVVGLAVPALLSLPSLAVFGRERRALRLYIPLIGARRLILLRWVDGVLDTARLGSFGVTAFLLGAIASGSPLDPAPLLASAAAGCVVFPTLAIGLGALLPDSAARSMLLPGASRLSILLYGAIAATAIGIATFDGGPALHASSLGGPVEGVSVATAVGAAVLSSSLAIADRIWRS
jgi:hypothetical protein